MTITRILASVSALALMAGAAHAGTYEKTATGVVVHPDTGSAKEIRLEVMNDSIIHVLALDDAGREQIPSLMTVATPQAGDYPVTEAKGFVTLKAPKASAKVDLKTGLITFYNDKGVAVLNETKAAITPVTVEDKPYVATYAQFNPGTTEGFYGLGQHQNAQMNLNGEDLLLSQHNMDVAIPFVVSDKNYGLLWDNNSITRWGNPTPYALFSRDLKLADEGGKPGLTARYYVDDKLVLTRTEDDIKYQYLKDIKEFWPTDPALSKTATQGKKVKVVWDGTMTSDISGVHKMQLYSSDYADLTIGGKKVMSVWRQGWNPWYHNFEQSFTKGQPVSFHLEWQTSGGMVAVTHDNPLPAADAHALTLSSEAGTGLNYYFIAADSIDGAIGGYRYLTGAAPMMPKWAFGFWQSRQRYETQDQLLGVLKDYRARGWPIDNMVQDWFYWPQDQWGSHDFDPKRFPDPQGLVDAVHAEHAHIMISIWGKFYANTDNYKEFESKGYMFTQNVKNGSLDWVGPGYLNSHYSPYNQEARDIYYRQLKDKLIDKGFDAWWMDNTEPDVNSNERPADFAKLITPTQMGPGAIVHNAYALMNTKAMYDGLKRDQPDKRQFILTRSGFAGVQRNAAAVWSGDTAGEWNNLHDQISAGVSFSMSGIPNWTHDIGGYAQENRFQVGDVGDAQENRSVGNTVSTPADLKEWQELNLRWFEFGAFSPLFRSHGEVVKREIFNISPDGSDMRDAMVWYDKLRYRLMPYIYTTASDTYFNSGTIMRGLVMDFTDPKVKDIKDQYLFGHAIMVAPVYTYGARSRSVYLPAGASWYNYYTGEKSTGGKTVDVEAPVTQIPLFIKAGSLIPTGPVTQYVDEKPDAPLTVNVYTGADGSFSLYEDDGVSNAYVKGGFTRIPLAYNDKTGELTIGARSGSYDGMVANRVFRVRFITPGTSSSASFDDYDKEIAYNGTAVVVKR